MSRFTRIPAKDDAGELERIFRTNDRGQKVLAAEGYEFERTCCAPEGEAKWTERVLVVRSPAHAARQAAGLETRLVNAEKKPDSIGLCGKIVTPSHHA